MRKRLLAAVDDPVRYNDEVIWPEKVSINRSYVENYRFLNDVKFLLATFSSVVGKQAIASVDAERRA